MDYKETLKIIKDAQRNNDIVAILPKSYTAKVLISALHELEEYQRIGTLEEVQVAMEKRTPVKPKIKKTSRTVTDIYDCVWEEKADIYECPCCNSFICFVGGNHNIYHCFGCGQKLDWSE